MTPKNTSKRRWMSPDPLAGDVSNPQSLNRYAYVLNNPVSNIDPSGLSSCGDDVGSGDTVSGSGVIHVTSWAPCPASDNVGLLPSQAPEIPGSGGSSSGGSGGAANTGTPQQPTKTQERLERLKNCSLDYYGIDPLSVSGLTSNGAKWGLIAAGAGGIPKVIPESLGLVRAIRPPGSSSFTSLFSILSASTTGGGALRTIANFGSKWAGPIAIASAVIDATAIGICTAMD